MAVINEAPLNGRARATVWLMAGGVAKVTEEEILRPAVEVSWEVLVLELVAWGALLFVHAEVPPREEKPVGQAVQTELANP